MTKKYEELSKKILDLVGGKDNISYFTHCITRLRFNVRDKSLVNISEIEKCVGVFGTQWSGEQLQVIIGNDVSTVYTEICNISGLKEETAIQENLDEKPKKKFSINYLLENIAGCVIPAIPILMAGGMLKVLLLVLTQFNLLSKTGETYVTLQFVADAAFYFLPVFVGATAAKKLKTNMALGMLLGAVLIHPTFISMVSGGSTMSIFGIPIYAATYTSTVLPIIITVFLMRYVERFFEKYTPNLLKSLVVPLGTLLVMTPVMLCFVAPAGFFIGNCMGSAITWVVNNFGFAAIAILAVLNPFLTLTGMHYGLIPVAVQTFITYGYSPTSGISFITNLSQGSASLAVALKTKNSNLRSLSVSSGITAIVGGISEPGLFGVLLRYKTPLYGSLIGSFCGGAIFGLMHVYAYAFPASSGLLGLSCLIGPNSSNLIYGIIGIIVAMIVSFISTYILYKDEESNE